MNTFWTKIPSLAQVRLASARERFPGCVNLPGFRQIAEAIEGQEVSCREMQPDIFDALVAVALLLNDFEDVPPVTYSEALLRVVEKIRLKGGPKAPPQQVVDAIYEGIVFLVLSQTVPGISFPAEERLGSSDIRLSIHYQASGKDSSLAIECKNIRTRSSDVATLIRKVSGAFQEGRLQALKRIPTNEDYIVFIDLPLALLLELEQNPETYIKLCLGVKSQLQLEGIDDYDEGRIVFTSTFQQGMGEILSSGKYHGFTVLKPVVSMKSQGIIAKAARAIFLSYIAAEVGQAPNINNWGKLALSVDPDLYEIGIGR